MKLQLREAAPEDEELLLEWRNEAATRAQSFSGDAITPEEHHAWFSAALASRGTIRIWILMCDDRAAGQVRYRKDGDAGEISISVDASFRGRGLSVELLRRSAPLACRELVVRQLRGLVKPSNGASLAAFARAGFERVADETMAGDACAVFVFQCPNE